MLKSAFSPIAATRAGSHERPQLGRKQSVRFYLKTTNSGQAAFGEMRKAAESLLLGGQWTLSRAIAKQRPSIKDCNKIYHR
jgi:hypothetical protein